MRSLPIATLQPYSEAMKPKRPIFSPSEAVFLLICLCCLLSARSRAADTIKKQLLRYNCAESAEFVFEVPTAKAETLPKWVPETGKPAPLSISRACALAKQALKTGRPDLEDFEVYEITMRHIDWLRVHETHSTETWFYEIHCRAKKNNEYTRPCGLIALILMDGTNVEPVIRRQQKEERGP